MEPAGHTALVVAYGNLSRRDDGLAHHIVRALEPMIGPGARAALLAVHQLDVTLAELVASQDLVIFVDAEVRKPSSAPVRVSTLSAGPIAPADTASHSLSPESLLGLAGWLYDHVPRAALVTVAAETFAFGEELTPATRASIPLATRAVMDLLTGFV